MQNGANLRKARKIRCNCAQSSQNTVQFCVKLIKHGPNFAGPPISVFFVLAPSGHIVKFRMQFSSKQVVARRFMTFWGPTEVMTAFYNANLLRRITLFSFLDCGPFKRLAAPLQSNRGQGPLFLGS